MSKKKTPNMMQLQIRTAAVITEDITTKYTFKNVFIGHRSNLFW